MPWRALPPAAREGWWHAPDGHRLRTIEWPEPDGAARGSLLFMPGRGDFYEKWLESLEHWRGQGWRVTSADWRGQAGSGRLSGPHEAGHVDDFAVWIGDFAALWGYWAAGREGPLVLASHSMGGHLVLRAALEGRLVPPPQAVVLTAPMLDVQPERVPLVLRRALAALRVAMGDPRRPAWKWSERPGELPPGRQALLTHDDRRYEDEIHWRRERPGLSTGPASWGWVRAALASIARLRAPGLLERFTVPVLVLAAQSDRLVGLAAIRRAVARLPRGELKLFGPGVRHEILREADQWRDEALAEIDAFLDRVTGPRA